jgi:hypothetical protein
MARMCPKCAVVERTQWPTQCAGHALKDGTFGEYARCGPECAACKLNVPGVRMYVVAGFGLSRPGARVIHLSLSKIS